ncbi:AAA family ATPase [Streptosporangiaceae bacterium NEAU-GS5]|nr:AAA family ATPase [Streptosporangiaceae bacterium NEAU-GS5]
MDGFIGRERELTKLSRLFQKVESGGRIGRPGRALLLRGRRRVGKSRLAEEFIRRTGVPHLFFAAERETLAEQLQRFRAEAAASNLPGASVFAETAAESWSAAFQLLTLAVPKDSPSIVVMDELPYMIAADPYLESKLQRWFDREFSTVPMLLVLIGSDLSMMEAINQYDHPFYMRAGEMVVDSLNPADVASHIGLPAAEAVDAHLVTGGLPMLCEAWEPGMGLWDYLEDAVTDSTSPMVVSGERALAAEFPADAHARVLLRAVGTGQRTFSSIAKATGGLPNTSMNRALQLLIEKRVLIPELPISTKASREMRYHLSDGHLRFWLSFIGPNLQQIERGRGDLVLDRIKKSWTSWRGMAVEPLIRESLRRMDGLPEETGAIGGYWTRANDVEIDIVGADREPIAKKITMIGSIKWREDKPFDGHDLRALVAQQSRVPGADTGTPLYAVARSGATVSEGITVVAPEDLIAAWR